MMHMTFYWGWQVTLLFDEWKTHSVIQYWASLLVLFAVSLFHEYVVSLRAHLRTSQLLKQTENFMEGQAMLLPGQFKKRAYILKAGETMLFSVNALLGYLLMLAAMSYNGGVVLVIVLGLSVGFFWFRSGNYVAQEEELQLSSDPCSSCT